MRLKDWIKDIGSMRNAPRVEVEDVPLGIEDVVVGGELATLIATRLVIGSAVKRVPSKVVDIGGLVVTRILQRVLVNIEHVVIYDLPGANG